MITDTYILFQGENYYPRGGWNDYSGTFSSINEAEQAFLSREELEADWAHIVDVDEGIIRVWVPLRGWTDDDDDDRYGKTTVLSRQEAYEQLKSEQ